jgi:uncharacterized repeat protein (TIGR01451 family)
LRLISFWGVLAGCACAYGQPFAYVTNAPANGVTVFNTSLNAVQTFVPGFSATVKGLAIARDGTRAYVADYGASSVGIINTVTNFNAGTIALATKPNAVAVTPDGTRVYAASEAGLVYVIDPFAKQVLSTITPTGPNVFEHIIVNKDGTRAYAASQSGSGSVVVINITNNTVVTTVPTQAIPEYMTLNAAGSILYAATRDGLVQINTANNTFIRRDLTGTSFQGITLNPAGTAAYLTSESTGAVRTWNIAANTAGAAGNAGMPVRGIAAVDNTFVLLTAPTNNKVVRYDVSTNTPQPVDLPIAGAPSQIAIAPLRQLAGCIPGFLFSGSAAGLPSTAGSSAVGFDLNPACTWTATTNVPWITITQASGTGPGIVLYNIAANPSQFSRTGAIFINGRRFLVTQAGTQCTYSIAPGSKQAPATFDFAIIGVGAPAGCEWTATTDVPWIDLGPNPSGSGSGFLIPQLMPNPTASRRTGTIFVAGQRFSVTQAATGSSYVCQGIGGTFDSVREEGLADGLEDLRIICNGPVPPGGATGEILVTYNVAITSKLTGPSPDDVDVWLILNEAVNPVIGTTAFRGKLAGPTSIRFQNVPLTNVANGTATFRIVNVRVNGSSLPPFQPLGPLVAAVVQIRSTKFIPVSGDFAALGLSGPGMSTTVSETVPVNGGTYQLLPVTFSELSNAHFRPKTKPPGTTIFRSEAENMFMHPNLGAQTGVADTGTRLRLRIPIAQGVRVWAPARLTGSIAAQLVSADENGFGGATVNGTALFGGMYQELTPLSGFATAVWEVTAADVMTIENATAAMVFQGGDLTAITRGLVPSFAPINAKGAPDATLPVPRFLDPLAAPRVVNLRVTPTVQLLSSASSKIGARFVVGSNFRFDYQVANDGTDAATNVVVRGNLPPGFNYTSCTRTDGGPCEVSGSEARAELPQLDGGGSVTLSVLATQSVDIPGGTVLENSVSASSDQIDADIQSNQASTAFLLDTCAVTLSENSASFGPGGGTGSFTFGSCLYWVAQSDVSWIRITSAASGTGAGAVNYNVLPNSTTAARTGTIVAAGRAYTVTQGPGTGCANVLAVNADVLGPAGAKKKVQLTVTGTICSWTASSPVPWIQVYPLSGTTSTQVEYNVFPNFGVLQRTGTILIGGQPLVVTQVGAAGTNDERFVQLVYFNFLGRLPTPIELAAQVAVLQAGTPRGQFIQSFFNTEEFNLGGRFIAGLYVGLLDRDAEYSGWLFQRDALARGLRQSQFVTNFINSAEFKLFGNMTASQFVIRLYRSILLREPGATEVTFHVSTSLTPDTPEARVELARRFLNTSEFRNGAGARLTAFLLYATLLQREASPGDRALRIAQLNAGTPVIDLINAFIATPEFTNLIN